jgi:hypothetical protein
VKFTSITVTTSTGLLRRVGFTSHCLTASRPPAAADGRWQPRDPEWSRPCRLLRSDGLHLVYEPAWQAVGRKAGARIAIAACTLPPTRVRCGVGLGAPPSGWRGGGAAVGTDPMMPPMTPPAAPPGTRRQGRRQPPCAPVAAGGSSSFNHVISLNSLRHQLAGIELARNHFHNLAPQPREEAAVAAEAGRRGRSAASSGGVGEKRRNNDRGCDANHLHQKETTTVHGLWVSTRPRMFAQTCSFLTYKPLHYCRGSVLAAPSLSRSVPHFAFHRGLPPLAGGAASPAGPVPLLGRATVPLPPARVKTSSSADPRNCAK